MGDGQAEFDLGTFLPYLLNQAAEATSRSFQDTYRQAYGMTRTQWRVLANLGKFGSMTASEICRISHLEKTKVSRAVTALEEAGHLTRTPGTDDRRTEILSLTPSGLAVFRDLGTRATEFERALRARLGEARAELLAGLLRELAGPAEGPGGEG